MGTWSQMCSCQTYCLQWCIPKWPYRVWNARNVHRSSLQIWGGNKRNNKNPKPRRKKSATYSSWCLNFPVSHAGKYLCSCWHFGQYFIISVILCQIRLYFVHLDVHLILIVAKQQEVLSPGLGWLQMFTKTHQTCWWWLILGYRLLTSCLILLCPFFECSWFCCTMISFSSSGCLM